MKLFAFEGFSACVCMCMCVCQHWEKQLTLWPGTRGGLGRRTPTHTHSLCCQHFFFSLLACMKRLFRPAVPLQAQLWSLTLFRENISFTLWCLLIYKKANPTLKIAWLVWNSGRMKQTLSGTQMLVKTTFIFHSDHMIILLFFDTDANVVGTYCGWALMPAFGEQSRKKISITILLFPSAPMRPLS